jgi:hypothetical protein
MTPMMFVSNIDSTVSSFAPSIGPTVVTPALFTTTSRRPALRTTRLTASCSRVEHLGGQ